LSPLQSVFAHRNNPDGTIDSICRECLLTIASSQWEADLERAESSHKCDPHRVEELRKAITDHRKAK
jgi:hypothetical protein